ncbi:YI31B [Hepatospora eriocheir]|uniref:YI31B n=1 Tax=Hepatospora eriocheir TaxID=1081669 RepID=A0A1X0QJW2_9MICR|nr:YI31B [Hepatospora eriocheir]
MRVPFGLANTPRAFVNAIQEIFEEIEFVRIFIDDVLIFSKSFDEHIRHLEKLLNLMFKSNLSVNFIKSVFCQESVKYLGLIIDLEGVKPDMNELCKFEKKMQVRNKKDIMRLVGFLNYYRPFVQNMSKK